MTALALRSDFRAIPPMEPGAIRLALMGPVVVWWHRAEFDTVNAFERHLVAELAATPEPDDVLFVLDELGQSEAGYRVSLALSTLGKSTLVQIIGKGLAGDRWWRRLGPVVAAKVELGVSYLQALSEIPAPSASASPKAWESLAAAVIDSETPRPVARAILSLFRVIPCFLALGRCASERAALPHRTVGQLADLFVDGCKATLRLAALAPGVDVDERVLPPEERFDPEALLAEHEQAMRALDAVPRGEVPPDSTR